MVFLPSERLLSIYLRGTEMKSSVHWSDSCKQKWSWWSSGHLSSSQHPFSMSIRPLLAFYYWLLPYPACISYEGFFFPRDELWLVLNVLGVKHPVFLWVIWPCQRPTAFPNDIMGFSWELLEKSDYGIQGTSARPSTFQWVVWRYWTRTLWMCVSFAPKSGGWQSRAWGPNLATLALADFTKSISLAHIHSDVLQYWLRSFSHHLYVELSWYATGHMVLKAQNLSHLTFSEKVHYGIFFDFVVV